MEQNTTAVRTTGLTKTYDGIDRVRNLDLEIRKGEIYGFLGPNGAGKSTTMKMLLGLSRPSAGEIEILGTTLNDKTRPEILSRVGSIIESPSYYGHLSASENMKIIETLLDLQRIQQDYFFPRDHHDIARLGDLGIEAAKRFAKNTLDPVPLHGISHFFRNSDAETYHL